MKLRSLTKSEELEFRQHLKEYCGWKRKSIDDFLERSIYDNRTGSMPTIFTNINEPFKIIDWEEEIKQNHYFSNVKVGDKVWHYDRGFGTVSAVHLQFNAGYLFGIHPIFVTFNDNDSGFGMCFNLDGGAVSIGQNIGGGRRIARFDDVRRQKLFYAEDAFVVYIEGNKKNENN